LDTFPLQLSFDCFLLVARPKFKWKQVFSRVPKGTTRLLLGIKVKHLADAEAEDEVNEKALPLEVEREEKEVKEDEDGENKKGEEGGGDGEKEGEKEKEEDEEGFPNMELEIQDFSDEDVAWKNVDDDDVGNLDDAGGGGDDEEPVY